VFLPFVAGYYLSFLFRSINALIAGSLSSELSLGAGDLSLLTSVYFLTFAAAQIPIGVLLDRYGPRRIQSAFLVVAAAGAALFGASDNFLVLLAGRALIGLGVAAALSTGLKALILWFPKDRLTLLNGLMIMLAALGAVTATLPAELLLIYISWRGLFELLAAVTAGCAVMIYLVVPEPASAVPVSSGAVADGLRAVYTDRRFWRLAPLSATCIGTAWALQGLWAAQWLTDVEGLDRAALVQHLFAMAVALSLGALLLGVNGRSPASARHRTASPLGTRRNRVHHGSAGVDPAMAVAVIHPLGRRGGGRRCYCPQLCYSGRVFSQGARRPG
jgi:MFS family permease